MVIHGRGAAAPGLLGRASSLQPGWTGSSRLPGEPIPTSLPHGGFFLRQGSKTSPPPAFTEIYCFTCSGTPLSGRCAGDRCPLGRAARVGRWGEHFNADTLQVAATRMGATISLTGNCNTFPILLVFTVFFGLFSFQKTCRLVLHSESFSHFCFALVKEQHWAIFLGISLVLTAFFFMSSLLGCKCPCMRLAMPRQPAQLLGTGRRTMFETVTWHLTSHGNSCDHKHFWDPQGKEKKKQLLLPVIYRYHGGLGKPLSRTAIFTPSVKVIKGHSNQRMSQPLKMQMQHIFFKDLALLFIFCLST